MCLGSCIGSCCATCGCECLKACCPSTKNMSRLPYIALMFFATLLALILRYYGGPILVDLYIYNWELCTSDKCVGFGAVYRISFALFVFFLVLGLLLLAQSCYSVDRGHWGLKLFSFLALLVISWLIPNDFYEVYVHISRVVSGVFLFLQILILLDFAISLNEELVERKDAKAVVLALSLAFYAASLVLMVFMFIWFAGDGCHVEKFILAFTICTTFVFTLLSLSSAAANRGGLLPAAVMSLYIHYVAYSALSSNPSSCNTLHDTSTVQLVIGLIIASLSISYAAWNLATSNSLFGDPKDEDDVRAEKEQQMSKAVASGDLGTATMNSAAAADVKSADAVVVPVKAEAEAPAEPKRSRVKPSDAASGSGSGDDDVDPAELARQDAANATRNARFHFVMAAAGMYMAMILTNWSNYKVGVDELDGQTSDFGLESMWIKVVSQWVTVLLYIWWLLAPIICSNRDFSNDS